MRSGNAGWPPTRRDAGHPPRTARFSALYKIQRAKAPSVGHDRCKAAIRMPRPPRPVMSPSRLPQVPPPALPPLVAAYVQATNSFDLDGLLATFADDALVNDQLRDYWGKPAIREWAARDIIGQSLTMNVTSTIEHYGNVMVTANIGGKFDMSGLPDPLVYAFYFTAYADRIVQLIILRNRYDV